MKIIVSTRGGKNPSQLDEGALEALTAKVTNCGGEKLIAFMTDNAGISALSFVKKINPEISTTLGLKEENFSFKKIRDCADVLCMDTVWIMSRSSNIAKILFEAQEALSGRVFDSNLLPGNEHRKAVLFDFKNKIVKKI